MDCTLKWALQGAMAFVFLLVVAAILIGERYGRRP